MDLQTIERSPPGAHLERRWMDPLQYLAILLMFLLPNSNGMWGATVFLLLTIRITSCTDLYDLQHQKLPLHPGKRHGWEFSRIHSYKIKAQYSGATFGVKPLCSLFCSSSTISLILLRNRNSKHLPITGRTVIPL
jgi:hypothetical protein